MLSATPQASTDPRERAAAEQLARNLRALADPTRVQILVLIAESAGGHRPVTELAV